MSKIYHIYFSHSWSYGDIFGRLISMLQEDPDFSFQGHGIDFDDPIHQEKNTFKLHNEIRKQMEPCEVLLIMAGEDKLFAKWINREIEIARETIFTRKPIIAIEPWGPDPVSKVVRDGADIEVRWNAREIIQAIRNNAGLSYKI